MTTHPEQQYLALLAECAAAPVLPDRTGVGRRSVFGRQLRYDLAGGAVPLLTTKRVHFHSVLVELLWMLRGDTNVKWLQDNGVSIWDEWADENGYIGPVYGYQWRRCGSDPLDEYDGIDQIAALLRGIVSNPHSSRHVVSAWNVEDLHAMRLPPCHVLFQFHVAADERLSCSVYQRSADVFLGLPFNLVSYALLTHIVARCVRRRPGDLIFNLGDVHLYDNHTHQAEVQLARKPTVARPWVALAFDPDSDLTDLDPVNHFTLLNYHAHPTIAAPVAV